jgi:molybdopterin-binding protein
VVSQAREPAPTPLSASVVWAGRPRALRVAVIFLLRSQIGASEATPFLIFTNLPSESHSRVETRRRSRNSGLQFSIVPHYRIAQAASLLGVSDDTVRRWIDSGRLRASSSGGPTTIDGAELAAHAQEIATAPDLGRPVAESARNRFTGLVTRVIKDSVMAQVDLQCGPFRVVSLMSAEAATELQLEPGVLAVASVKSTHVVVEIPADR